MRPMRHPGGKYFLFTGTFYATLADGCQTFLLFKKRKNSDVYMKSLKF